LERGFFLKYADYRRGLRLVINHDQTTTTRIDYNVEPAEGDECFQGIQGIVVLQDRLRALYPESYSIKGVSQGDVYFAGIFHSLHESVARRLRRKRSSSKSSGRGK
jgi:hypothetical protein